MTSTGIRTDQDSIVLACNLCNGESVAYWLKSEASVFIGCGESCAMRVNADTIAHRHCMVRYATGVVTITDWFSEEGTFVNNRRITEETRIDPNDVVRVGRHELKIMPSHASEAATKNVSGPAAATTQPPARELAKPKESASSRDPASGGPKTATQETVMRGADESIAMPSRARLLVELAQAQDEIAFLRSELEARLESETKRTPVHPSDVAHQAELDALRAENQFLQAELAAREATAFGVDPLTGSHRAHAAVTDANDTETLVRRLEALLEELQIADRRAAALDDLLRSAADENRAEVDERERLEDWVGEIEQRVTEWEGAWQAERSRLEAKLAEQVELRQRADQSLAEAIQAQDKGPGQRLLLELQSRYDQAISQLEKAHGQIERLEKIAQANGENGEAARRVRELEELIRQRDVSQSHERASLARERADLDRLRADLERNPRSLDKADDTAIRIQAFRDHLRGIHEQEQTVARTAKSQGLAARIAKLWNRLDSDQR